MHQEATASWEPGNTKGGSHPSCREGGEKMGGCRGISLMLVKPETSRFSWVVCLEFWVSGV